MDRVVVRDVVHRLVLPTPLLCIGKYPHLVARVVSKSTKKMAATAPGTSWQPEVTVNFHEVAVGTTVEKCIEIANVSPVRTDKLLNLCNE